VIRGNPPAGEEMGKRREIRRRRERGDSETQINKAITATPKGKLWVRRGIGI